MMSGAQVARMYSGRRRSSRLAPKRTATTMSIGSDALREGRSRGARQPHPPASLAFAGVSLGDVPLASRPGPASTPCVPELPPAPPPDVGAPPVMTLTPASTVPAPPSAAAPPREAVPPDAAPPSLSVEFAQPEGMFDSSIPSGRTP